MQLFRLLQSQGFGSRRECHDLIRAGRVSLAGCVERNAEREYDPAGLEFSVDGGAWQYREKVYLLLHKPAGYECSRDAQHHPSVFALLPAPLVNRGVQPVGRLDQDSAGLLLLSDDGAFIHRYTSPKKGVAKTYRVTCKHPVDDAQIAALLGGVVLRDDPVPVAARSCTRIGEQELELSIAEGRYHQVKRMLAAAGNRVEGLTRTRLGGLELPPDLAPGQWRYLDESDLVRLAAAIPPALP